MKCTASAQRCSAAAPPSSPASTAPAASAAAGGSFARRRPSQKKARARHLQQILQVRTWAALETLPTHSYSAQPADSAAGPMNHSLISRDGARKLSARPGTPCDRGKYSAEKNIGMHRRRPDLPQKVRGRDPENLE